MVIAGKMMWDDIVNPNWTRASPSVVVRRTVGAGTNRASRMGRTCAGDANIRRRCECAVPILSRLDWACGNPGHVSDSTDIALRRDFEQCRANWANGRQQAARANDISRQGDERVKQELSM